MRQLTVWLAMALTIIVHTVTLTWWAATLSAGQQGLKELFLKDVAAMREILNDHEQRLRIQEQAMRQPQHPR